jgi:hypothetical protein
MDKIFYDIIMSLIEGSIDTNDIGRKNITASLIRSSVDTYTLNCNSAISRIDFKFYFNTDKIRKSIGKEIYTPTQEMSGYVDTYHKTIYLDSSYKAYDTRIRMCVAYKQYNKDALKNFN